jgi:hypothetical protein
MNIKRHIVTGLAVLLVLTIASVLAILAGLGGFVWSLFST